MSGESANREGPLPGIDPTYSPAMRKILFRYAANRLSLRKSRAVLAQARESLAALVAECDRLPSSRVKPAGASLVAAQDDKQSATFQAFTEALVELAKQYPPGASERAAIFRTIDRATQLMATAQRARSEEYAALLRLNALAREAEAQHALERKQGGGVH